MILVVVHVNFEKIEKLEIWSDMGQIMTLKFDLKPDLI